MRLKSEQRRLIGVFVKMKISINAIAQSFFCSRQTIWHWKNQDLRTRFDIPHVYKGKVTIEVEITILFLRSLGYGCARIKQRLFNAPEIELKLTENYVQGIVISRTTINNILRKHKLNGYNNKRNQKAWKFFRAECPNELWQLDMKEFKFEGKKYVFIVCVDDYSRFLICAKLFGHSPSIKEISQTILPFIEKHKPQKILTDNNPFKDSWKFWCNEQGIKAIFAHPYYPQDKGKVERTNRNISEELINIILRFHKLLNEQEITSWINWFNQKRFSYGIKDFPANLYVKN